MEMGLCGYIGDSRNPFQNPPTDRDVVHTSQRVRDPRPAIGHAHKVFEFGPSLGLLGLG